MEIIHGKPMIWNLTEFFPFIEKGQHAAIGNQIDGL